MRKDLEKMRREITAAIFEGRALVGEQLVQFDRILRDLLVNYALIDREYALQKLTRTSFEALPPGAPEDPGEWLTSPGVPYFCPQRQVLKLELYAASSMVVDMKYLDNYAKDAMTRQLMNQLMMALEDKKLGTK